MSPDLLQMEWLYHVDLDVTKHGSKADLQKTAGIAWDCIQRNCKPQQGDLLVICVVRPQASESRHASTPTA